MDETFDYIVVGAGSAGCVVAARLSAHPAATVLLLEAGPPPASPWITMPAGLPRLLGRSRYNWPDMAAPAPGLNGRSLWIGHGRTLGGSSAINGMVYNRGHPADFDAWERSGCPGWGSTDVLQHFRAVEAAVQPSQLAYVHPSVEAFVNAGVALGLPASGEDDRDREGIGLCRMSVRAGRRRSSYDAFVAEGWPRHNLEIRAGAEISHILIDHHRAMGVDYVRGDGHRQAYARCEVIVCAGTIDSPRLLMVSGIGPGEHLRKMGVAVTRDSAGVGANLQDHLAIGLTLETTKMGSLNPSIAGWRQLLHGVRYLVSRTGPATLGSSSGQAIVCTGTDVSRPQVQLNFRPFSVSRSDRAAYKVDARPAVSASATWLHPRSRGTVRLTGSGFRDRPSIDPGYLSDHRDADGMVTALRLLAAVFATEPVRSLVTSTNIAGSAEQTDAETLAYIRAGATSMAHPVGTCRMSASADAVVDPDLRVRGIERLRVADASVMPDLPSGNTNAAAMMIGDKAATIIERAWR